VSQETHKPIPVFFRCVSVAEGLSEPSLLLGLTRILFTIAHVTDQPTVFNLPMHDARLLSAILATCHRGLLNKLRHLMLRTSCRKAEALWRNMA
jgi:hypothetical protein